MLKSNLAATDGNNGEKKGPLTKSQLGIQDGDEILHDESDAGFKQSTKSNQKKEPQRSMGERAKEGLSRAKQKLKSGVHVAKRDLQPFDTWVRTGVREHPYGVLAATVGTGILAGVLIRRTAVLMAGVSLGVVIAYYISRRAADSSPHPADPSMP